MIKTPLFLIVCAGALGACGGSQPPPKTEETPKEEAAKRPEGPAPSVSQELGSIDQRAVEQTFNKLQGPLEGCHKQGRDRVDVMSGDVKVFLRVDGTGKVRYSYFEESTLGDRETEKCILDVFAKADWPKPQGGEAEVRNGFGWSAGGERPPTSWTSDKVLGALDEEKDVKKSVDKCKAGVTGVFQVTAYVEADDSAESANPAPPPEQHAAAKPAGKGAGKGKGGKKAGKKGDKHGPHGGKFKAIGVSAPSKDAGEKVDCIVDALKGLTLPSPGSYVAKVTFNI